MLKMLLSCTKMAKRQKIFIYLIEQLSIHLNLNVHVCNEVLFNIFNNILFLFVLSQECLG